MAVGVRGLVCDQANPSEPCSQLGGRWGYCDAWRQRDAFCAELAVGFTRWVSSSESSIGDELTA